MQFPIKAGGHSVVFAHTEHTICCPTRRILHLRLTLAGLEPAIFGSKEALSIRPQGHMIRISSDLHDALHSVVTWYRGERCDIA